MSWLSDKLNKFHGHTKKYEPLGHYTVGGGLKAGDWLVKNTGKGLRKAGLSGYMGEQNERVIDKAGENQGDFGKSASRAGSVAALIYGGMYGAGALGAGEAGGSAGAAGGGTALGTGEGAFLGEGVASGVPAWDGAAGGMGLGFDPNGLGGSGSSLASDFPNMGSGNGWMSKLSGMIGKGGGGGGGGGTTQNQVLAQQLRDRRNETLEQEQEQAQAAMAAQPAESFTNQSVGQLTPEEQQQLLFLLQQRQQQGVA